MMTIAPALNGITRLFNGRRVSMLMIIVLLGSLLSLAACDDDASEVNFPSPIPESSRTWLFDVYGTSATDIYVGGNMGVMYHYNGSDWSRQNMGTTAAITSIWSPPTESVMYATGHNGHIWQNNGAGWSGMNSGTSNDLYAIGSYQFKVHAVGDNGAIRVLNGGSWGGVGTDMLLLDENLTPTDTLSVVKDIASLVAVNHYFVGGAFFDPRYEGDTTGIIGTKGCVLAPNTDDELNADWILRPISGEQIVDAEWVTAMHSDSADISRNYLGTSEGWLFRLGVGNTGKEVWSQFYPEFTDDPGAGIRDIWVDDTGNVYAVTDEGKVIYQTANYVFGSIDENEYRMELHDGSSALVGIWGTGPDNIYFTGFYDEVLFHGVHVATPDSVNFVVDEIELVFPSKSAGNFGQTSSLAPGVDHIGRPLR